MGQLACLPAMAPIVSAAQQRGTCKRRWCHFFRWMSLARMLNALCRCGSFYIFVTSTSGYLRSQLIHCVHVSAFLWYTPAIGYSSCAACWEAIHSLP